MSDSRAEKDGERWRQMLAVWLMLDSKQRESLVEIARSMQDIGPNASEMLQKIAERLSVGAKQYGDWNEKKDWKRETIEEHLDATVYLTRALLDLNKEGE